MKISNGDVFERATRRAVVCYSHINLQPFLIDEDFNLLYFLGNDLTIEDMKERGWIYKGDIGILNMEVV